MAARDLVFDKHSDPRHVSLDVSRNANRISQVFSCLLDNAMRFTEKGAITISAKETKDSIRCGISDTGIGISREALPKVFDSFQSLPHSPQTSDKGIGAGLYLAKAIIELHKGTIHIESQLNKGTTVTFILPRSTP